MLLSEGYTEPALPLAGCSTERVGPCFLWMGKLQGWRVDMILAHNVKFTENQ